MSTRYFIRLTAKGDFSGLGRVTNDESGMSGEAYLCGEWIEDPMMTRIMFDGLVGDWIEESEVEHYKRLTDEKYPPRTP